ERTLLFVCVGELMMADVLLRGIVEELPEINNPRIGAEALRVRGTVAAEAGDLEGAASYYSEALGAARRSSNRLLEAEVTIGLARVATLRGDLDDATRLRATAVLTFRDIG